MRNLLCSFGEIVKESNGLGTIGAMKIGAAAVVRAGTLTVVAG